MQLVRQCLFTARCDRQAANEAHAGYNAGQALAMVGCIWQMASGLHDCQHMHAILQGYVLVQVRVKETAKPKQIEQTQSALCLQTLPCVS